MRRRAGLGRGLGVFHGCSGVDAVELGLVLHAGRARLDRHFVVICEGVFVVVHHGEIVKT